jgi:hypothetical protein
LLLPATLQRAGGASGACSFSIAYLAFLAVLALLLVGADSSEFA